MTSCKPRGLSPTMAPYRNTRNMVTQGRCGGHARTASTRGLRTKDRVDAVDDGKGIVLPRPQAHDLCALAPRQERTGLTALPTCRRTRRGKGLQIGMRSRLELQKRAEAMQKSGRGDLMVRMVFQTRIANPRDVLVGSEILGQGARVVEAPLHTGAEHIEMPGQHVGLAEGECGLQGRLLQVGMGTQCQLIRTGALALRLGDREHGDSAREMLEAHHGPAQKRGATKRRGHRVIHNEAFSLLAGTAAQRAQICDVNAGLIDGRNNLQAQIMGSGIAQKSERLARGAGPNQKARPRARKRTVALADVLDRRAQD